MKVFENHGDSRWIAEFYDWDTEGFAWIEMEYLVPIEFERDMPKKDVITPFTKEADLRLNECQRIDHWGRDSAGNLKLIDAGAAIAAT